MKLLRTHVMPDGELEMCVDNFPYPVSPSHTFFSSTSSGYYARSVSFSPMIPLSLLSRVELGLVMVPQGLERLRGGRLAVLLRVEHGLSVHGDAVLLVRVEQGLMPWLVAEDCRREAGKTEGSGHRRNALD